MAVETGILPNAQIPCRTGLLPTPFAVPFAVPQVIAQRPNDAARRIECVAADGLLRRLLVGQELIHRRTPEVAMAQVSSPEPRSPGPWHAPIRPLHRCPSKSYHSSPRFTKSSPAPLFNLHWAPTTARYFGTQLFNVGMIPERARVYRETLDCVVRPSLLR
jgi:hypothetical protein